MVDTCSRVNSELEGAEGVGLGGVGVGFGDGFGGAGVGITLHFSVAGGGLVSSVPDMFTAWPDCPSGHSKVTLAWLSRAMSLCPMLPFPVKVQPWSKTFEPPSA